MENKGINKLAYLLQSQKEKQFNPNHIFVFIFHNVYGVKEPVWCNQEKSAINTNQAILKMMKGN